MATLAWIKKMLEARGVLYEIGHHPDVFTSQDVAHAEHVSGHHVAKVVVVMADGRPVELILPATRRVLLDRVQQLLGAQEVRLATKAEMKSWFIDCETGAVPAVRHWRGVDILMDASMEVPGDIIFQGGTRLDAIHMRFADWFKVVHPKVASFSEPVDAHHEEQSPAIP